MNISRLDLSLNKSSDQKLLKAEIQLNSLIDELNQRELPDYISKKINQDIVEINSTKGSANKLRSVIKKKQTGILKFIEKEIEIVSKNHYRNSWMLLGMLMFGLPFGIIFSLLIDNMAFAGIGLPIGMGIGIAIGTEKDKKYQNENKQLNFENTFGY
ncbi:hypothetical protein OO013_05530 [Mangrovivirga sp. M17]|uniref:Uncharacterized protein n=1 Tax=Mangrovivirga halotolerans TaxID=2993936 RepID=A0ABT3RNC7_9BACT|nr:hypothetical protein [Mangrovivirga halotolerans]MCX2743315.1 hypothetical protein [Mangrovivirga halotolerans]